MKLVEVLIIIVALTLAIIIVAFPFTVFSLKAQDIEVKQNQIK